MSHVMRVFIYSREVAYLESIVGSLNSTNRKIKSVERDYLKSLIFSSIEMEKSIQALVDRIKKEMFSSVDLHRFVFASAYDTAWLAMIPDPETPSRPMFPQCVEWVLHNQQEFGYWGEEPNHSNQPTIECIPATVACMAALKTWNVGHDNIEKGLDFIHANTKKILLEQHGSKHRWFTIVFPGMLEFGWRKGLDIFPEGLPEVVKSIFTERRAILGMEKSSDHPFHHPPLIYYLEVLPPMYAIDWDEVLRHLTEDGSLFQSPSATARAFMVTKNKNSQHYLESMVQRYGYGVPPIFPIDEDLIKLCIVDRLEGLGLDEHFHREIEDILSSVYRNRIEHDLESLLKGHMSMLQIYKESLSYRLLTMHGYRISPRIFSLFSEDSKARDMDQIHDFCLSTVLSVYRASNFMFMEKNEADPKVKSSTKRMLEYGICTEKIQIPSNLHREVEHELRVPWLARLDHLEHRECIERGKTSNLWAGKASYLRSSCLNNALLLKLARDNYAHRQSIYRSELEELQRWSEDNGISSLGFGRNKTTYCYFALATTAYPTPMRAVRMTAAKNGILLTIIDDFFDDYGTPDELKSFADAIERWDGGGQQGRGKVLFDALDGAISDTAKQAFHVQGHDITDHLREIWCEAITSWVKEAEWARSCYRPSTSEYLRNAGISSAVQTSILSSLYLVGPTITEELTHHRDYRKLKELMMLSCRLLNDVRTYEKESNEGTLNLVLLLMQGDPNSRIEDVTAYITKMLERKKHKLLEHVLMDDKNCVPRPCRRLHLIGLIIFQMFYNSSNAFDSATELVQSINKAFYEPLSMQI